MPETGQRLRDREAGDAAEAAGAGETSVADDEGLLARLRAPA